MTNAKFQVVKTKYDGNLRIFKQNQNMMCLLIPNNNMITDTNMDSIYSSLIQKMKTTGLWVGQPTPDAAAAKKFKPELAQFVTNQSYLVREDKVAIAQQKVNETKTIASDNLKKLSQNNTEIEEELLPSAIEIALAGKEEEMIANEIQQEEVKRSRCLYLWIVAAILILLAIIVVIVLLVTK